VNKKGLLAVILAVVVPVSAYFVVKYASKDTVIMPLRFFPDTVISKVENGKEVNDTVWHQVRDFTLLNQLGDSVSLHDLPGKIIVADFFFTRCPSFCPRLSNSMRKLQRSFSKTDTSFVQFLSFSVDPENDSVPVLKGYADRYQANHDTWWLLTGNKKEIYDLAQHEFRLPIEGDTTGGVQFIHSNRLVLLDKEKVVRGYYNGEDSVAMARLAGDVALLLLERNRKVKRNLFRK
jgi:protein SCO1